MTQTHSKHTPTLVSVDRSGRMPIVARAADGGIEAHSTRPMETQEADVSKDESFDGFVFEEASASVSAAPTREPALQSVKRSTASSAPASAPAPRMATRASNMPAAAAPAAVKNVEEKRPSADDYAEHPASESPQRMSSSVPSGRGDLDLRGKLNAKEAELLALRVELSARDRLLLDLNNTSLDIERSRFELSEQLAQSTHSLQEAMEKIRAHEAGRDATAKRVEEMKVAFRRNEDNSKRKHEGELEALRAAHTTELAEQIAAHTSKFEQLERSNSAELARLHGMHVAAEEEANERHSEVIRNTEAACNKAVSNAVSMHARKVRALQEAQEKALAKAAAADAAVLEAALAAGASDKASALSEAENAHRATQSELAATQTTVQFLQRAQASQSDRITRQETKIVALEESSRRAIAKAEAAAETLESLRRALGAGLSLLNASSRTPEDE